MTSPLFACPCCGAVSCNPNDIAQRYCGRCHDWTGDPGLGARHLARDCPHRKTDPAFDDLARLIDAGLEVRIAPHGGGVKVTLYDEGQQVGEPVSAWPSVIVNAALILARRVADEARHAPGGVRP